jgi:hypothetical protein
MDELLLEEYKGFLVDGSVMIAHPNSNRWQSLGTVYSAKTRSPLIQIIRIEGERFDSKEAAIQHGFELAKRWVDEHGSAPVCQDAIYSTHKRLLNTKRC